jgi:hypothetical protein
MEISAQINAPVTVYRVRVGRNGAQMIGKFTGTSAISPLLQTRKEKIVCIITIISHK